MKLTEIKPLNEAFGRGDPNAQFDYDGEMDPQISNIEGHPYSMYVNEADPQLKHSVTFLVGSDDDDGVSWEVDLGTPQGRSVDYEAPSDHGPGGHEVEWERDAPQHDVMVDDMTNNPKLKQLIPHVTQGLKELQHSGNIEHAHNLFAQLLQQLNQ